MVLVDVSRTRILHSDAHTLGGGERNNVVRTCASGSSYVSRPEGGRDDGGIDEFTRKRTEPRNSRCAPWRYVIAMLIERN